VWYTGSNQPISIEEIINIAKKYIKNNGNVYVGTDSFISKNKCVFATALCLHGADTESGNRYFFKKSIVKKNKFSSLLQRITREVERTLELAELLYENDIEEFEIHIDVSPPNKATKTSKFSDMLMGYVKGNGFTCKIKPNAWASTSVADKHSK
jgi:hypothetical protein